MEISTVKELIQSLREGKYSSLGSYPKFWLCDDGGELSYEAVVENIWLVARSVRDKRKDGWQVIGVDINWEDADMYCSHTGKRIPSAYAEPEPCEGPEGLILETISGGVRSVKTLFRTLRPVLKDVQIWDAIDKLRQAGKIEYDPVSGKLTLLS